MVDSRVACELIHKFGDVTEKDHFGSDAFSANKRMFATVWHNEKRANIRLTPELQREFLMQNSEAFEEIDNAWGRQGWTQVNLEFIDQETFLNALQAAFECSSIKAERAVSTKPKAKSKARVKAKTKSRATSAKPKKKAAMKAAKKKSKATASKRGRK